MLTTRKLNLGLTVTCLVIFNAACLLFPATVNAQWTTPDANQNINSTNTGNVGVGNTAPKYKLDVQGSANNAQIRFGMDSSDSGGFLFSIQPAHATFAAGASWSNFGWTARALNASSVTSDSGTLRFYANSGLSPGAAFTPTERMRISPFGLVGIGTTNPTSKLHIVSGTDSGTTLLSLDTGIHGGTSMAVFGNSNNESGFDMSVYRAGQYFTRFGVNSAGDAYLQPSGGNVGIGTASPVYRLDVTGATPWIARFKKTDASNGGIIVDSATGFNPNVALAVNGTTKWYLLNNATGGDSLQFWESSGGFARFTLTQAGTVGIGTSTPNALYKLDVAGQVRSSTGGYVFPDGTVQVTAAAGGGGGTITGVTAGLGMSGGGTSGAVTLTNADRGSFQNIFKNIANAAGVTQFSAGSNTDSLRVEGTGGTTVAFDGVNRKITISGPASSGWTDNSSTINLTNTSGKVGVGTTAPLQRLQIGNNTTVSTATPDAVSLGGTFSSAAGANPKLRLFDNNAGAVYGLGVSSSQFDFMVPAATRYVWNVNGVEKMRLDDAGNITISGNINAKYQDVAEWVESSQELPAGTVVVLDSSKSNQVIASTQAYDSRVAGVISVRPGIALGEQSQNSVLVATTGRVKIKVDATDGPIQIGDLLVTSDKPGLAMKSVAVEIGGVRIHRPGTLIGKALEPLANGTGEILVLLSLQ